MQWSFKTGSTVYVHGENPNLHIQLHWICLGISVVSDPELFLRYHSREIPKRSLSLLASNSSATVNPVSKEHSFLTEPTDTDTFQYCKFINVCKGFIW